MVDFIDRVIIHAAGGDGGNGIASIEREKFKSLAGPGGGSDGSGGFVILEVGLQVTALLGYYRSPHQRAQLGTGGIGDLYQGKDSEGITLPVPDGTVMRSKRGELLADLTDAGSHYVVTEGGKGGLGNAAPASKARKTSGLAFLGESGEERDVVLELRSVADVTLVGFPSTGKPLLTAAMPTARPKIVDYPFTTLIPNLGVAQAGDTRHAIADVSGLIPGVSQGKGPDLDFLHHTGRCGVIIHVLGTAAYESEREPLTDLQTIEAKLGAYQSDLGQIKGYAPLVERPCVIVLNRVDILDGRDLAEIMHPNLEQFDWPIREASAATYKGLKELSFTLARLVLEHRASLLELETAYLVICPKVVDSRGVIMVRLTHRDGEEVHQVHGDKPKRWVRQTDFTSDETVDHPIDRLAVAGMEDVLMRVGVSTGDTVVIGDLDSGIVFDWEPILITEPKLLGQRDIDPRIKQSSRSTRKQRREVYHQVMDTKSAVREEPWMECQQGIRIDLDVEKDSK